MQDEGWNVVKRRVEEWAWDLVPIIRYFWTNKNIDVRRMKLRRRVYPPNWQVRSEYQSTRAREVQPISIVIDAIIIWLEKE